jgi:transposase
MNFTEEQKELFFLYKNSNEVKLRERYHVILLFKVGKRKKELSELFFVDEDTISSWISRWEEQKEVNDKKRSGRPPKLTQEEINELCEIVEENNPEKHGFNLSVWDCIELSKLCKQRLNKEISAESIRKILIKEGFSYKKIDYFFTKQDEEIRQKYIREIIDLHEIDFQDTEVYFSDEMSAKLHSKQNYVWSRNKKTILRTSCSQEKITVTGAVNIKSGNSIITVSDKNNCDAFINFIKEVDKKKEKSNVIIFVDNYPVHYAKKVLTFLETKPHIQIRYAPKYSPDLNPQEWFWAYLRKKCLNCYVVNSKKELKNSPILF